MKKIIAIIGTVNTNGNTFKTVENFLNLFSDEQYEKDIIFLSNYNINICRGCNNCFFQGKCPLDSQDDMPIIKQKLQKADILIFASPVYIKSISSIMKVFLDRIAYWTHLMKLKGKIGVVVSTTSLSGIDEVTSYLFYLMSHFGITVVGTICYCFNFDKFLEKQIEHVYNNILDIEGVIIPMYTSSLTESIFDSLKNLYLNIYNNYSNNKEAEYWKLHKYFEYNNLIDMIMTDKTNNEREDNGL